MTIVYITSAQVWVFLALVAASLVLAGADLWLRFVRRNEVVHALREISMQLDDHGFAQEAHVGELMQGLAQVDCALDSIESKIPDKKS